MFSELGCTSLDAVLGAKREVMGNDVGVCAVYHDTMFGVVSTSSVYRTGVVPHAPRIVTPHWLSYRPACLVENAIGC